MKPLYLVALLTLSTAAFAQDRLPDVESLLPGPSDYIGQSESSDYQYQADGEAPQDSQEQLLLNALRRINALQEQVQELNGKVEEQEYNLTQLQAMYKRELDSLKQVMAKMDNVAVEPVDVPTEMATKPATAFEFTPTREASRLEGEVYQSAYQHLQSKRYTQAKADFQEVLQNYPNGQFAPNANYWLGEIYLLQEQYDQAKNSFQAVIDRFATHPKSADALLKLGFVAIHQKEYDAARTYFIEVKEKFPNTVAARLAENRLNQLGNS